MAESKDFSAEAGSAKVIGTVSSSDIAEPVAPPVGLRAIGPRITFHFVGEWDAETSYVLYDVVRVNGTSYIGNKINIAKGVNPETDNNVHWVKWNDPNAQVELLQQTVNGFDGRITAAEAEAANAAGVAAEAKQTSADNAAAISAEVTRATAAEAENANAISAETARAKAAEAANTTAIETNSASISRIETTTNNATNITIPVFINKYDTFDTVFERMQKIAKYKKPNFNLVCYLDGAVKTPVATLARLSERLNTIGNVTSIKFHKSTIDATYTTEVNDVLNIIDKTKLKTVYVFNEIASDLDNVNQYIPFINSIQYQKGISMSGVDVYYLLRSEYKSFLAAFDVIGINYYPPIAVTDKRVPLNVIEEKMEENLYPISQLGYKTAITEIGILPYLYYYRNPAWYTGHGDEQKNYKAQRDYYSAIVSSGAFTNQEEVILWYIESMNDEMLDFIASII